MRRLLLLQLAVLVSGVVLGVIGWKTQDREVWVAATLCGVTGVVAGVVLIIAAIVEKRVLFAVGGLLLGGLAFLAAWWSLIVGFASADAEGRPLHVRGKRGRGAKWASGPVPDVPPDADEGARWLAAARAEHASVPAFARLAWQLSAHGAPPELIARAHQAALDEIVHARRCFAVASAYLGEEQHAEALPLPELGAGTLTRLAVESLVDGVLGAGRAAQRLELRAKAASDPVLRELLQQLATEERAHAQLAEDIVAWVRHGAREIPSSRIH